MTGELFNLNGLSPTIDNLGSGGGTITNTSANESILTLDLSPTRPSPGPFRTASPARAWSASSRKGPAT